MRHGTEIKSSYTSARLHHSLPKWMQVHHFYNGLNGRHKTLLDASAGGVLMSKSEYEAYQLL